MSNTDTLTRITPALVEEIERRIYVPRHAAPEPPAVGVAPVPERATVSPLGLLTKLLVGRRP